jgi:hypothetical protein
VNIAEPIWLKLKKVEILEPIIKTNNRIKPIMTKVIAADTNDITVVRKEDHAEESSYDLSALLNALNMFTVSSSQIQMQDLASALEELVQLPLPQVIFITTQIRLSDAYCFQLAGTRHRIN